MVVGLVFGFELNKSAATKTESEFGEKFKKGWDRKFLKVRPRKNNSHLVLKSGTLIYIKVP